MINYKREKEVGRMSRILRFFVFIVTVFYAGNSLAAGYTCSTDRLYTSCASGYYLSNCGSSTSGWTGQTISESSIKTANSCVKGTNTAYTYAGGAVCPKATSTSSSGYSCPTYKKYTSCNAGYYPSACGTDKTKWTGQTIAASEMVAGNSCIKGTDSGYTYQATAGTVCPKKAGITVTCAAGQYIPRGKTTCETCPADSFCSSGTYTIPASGATSPMGLRSCLDETQWQWEDYHSDDGDDLIDDMFYSNSDAGSTTIGQCYLTLMPGAAVYTQGGSLVVCRAGDYCNVDGERIYFNSDEHPNTGGATACAQGSYSAAGASACTACQNGTTTSGTGSTSCGVSCTGFAGTATWATATWNSDNTVTNRCAAASCDENYTLNERGYCEGKTYKITYIVVNNTPVDPNNLPGDANVESGQFEYMYDPRSDGERLPHYGDLIGEAALRELGRNNLSYADGYTWCPSDKWDPLRGCSESITNIPAGTSGNITLYAIWTYHVYQAELNLGSGILGLGNTTPSSGVVTIEELYGMTWADPSTGTEIASVEIPFNYGVFDGYYTAQTGGDQIIPATGVLPVPTTLNIDNTTDETMPLYAQYTEPTCRVEHGRGDMTNGCSEVRPLHTNADKFDNMLQVYVDCETGYSGADGDDYLTIDATTVGQTVFTGACLARTATVSFNANSGTGGQTATVTATYDAAMPTISTTAPTRAGYTFMGWYDNADYTKGAQYYTAAGASARTWNKTANTTLYAGWKADTYTITYNLNGGTNATANPATYNIETATITLGTPTKTGYTFGGWYTESAFTNKVTQIAKGSTGNKTFYAKWTAKIIPVTLRSYDDTTTHQTVYLKYDTGWFSDAAATTAITTITKPTRSGYTFRGYSMEKRGDQTANLSDVAPVAWVVRYDAKLLPGATAFSDATTLYAAWIRDCVQPSNGSCTMTINASNNFGQYTTKCNDNYTMASGNGTYNPVCSGNIYAITLNATQNGGTGGTSAIYQVYGTQWTSDNTGATKITSVTMPTKANNVFNGYYSAATGGTQYITNAGAISAGNKTFTADTTIYAQYSAASCNVTHGSATMTISGNRVSCAVTCNTGYSKSGGTDTTATFTTTGAVGAATVSASCVARTATVSFNANSGTGGQTATVTATYDAAMPTISTTAPTRTGYTFMGWYDNADYTKGTQYYTAAGASARTWNKTANTTLYAGWKINSYTCAAGQYLKAGATSCAACTAGNKCAGGSYTFNTSADQGLVACSGATEYQDATGQSSCKTPSNGHYKKDNTSQQVCGAGYFCAAGVREACPEKYVNGSATAGAKSECAIKTEAGKYIATVNSATQTPCPATKYCESELVYYGKKNEPTACPAADSTTARTTYPDDYLNPTMTSFNLQTWSTGLKSKSECQANYQFDNAAGHFVVESVLFNTSSGKYDVGGSKYYNKLNAGWYLTDRHSDTYCDVTTRTMIYKNAVACPAGSYCPGYNSMPLCSTGTYETEMGKFGCGDVYPNSPAKSGAQTACYLTTTPGKYVKTANSDQVRCELGDWCRGSVQVNYGSIGGNSHCSSLTGVSVTGGTYTSAAGSSANTACKYTAPNKTITGCKTVTTNTVTYNGTAWPATTYGVTANGGYIISGNNTATATCSRCDGAVWSAGGTATSCTPCPAQTSGWTRGTGNGWNAVTQCYQTKEVGGDCSAGVLKQNATSTTAWGASTISTPLQANPGSIVEGQRCKQCLAGTFSAGGTATSCSACSGSTQFSAANASQCSTVRAGYYTTGCNSSGNQCTGQSQCTSGTWCASGVQNQCSSLTGVSVTGGKYTSAAGATANTACKYTAPNKTIDGCKTVTTNTVTYTGTAWPATTYGVTANGGHIISGNNTAAATCSMCTGAKYSAGGAATSCTPCPAADNGWTAAAPNASITYAACYEYQTPANCASGRVKRAAASASGYSATIELVDTLKSNPGHYAGTTAISCTPCPIGSYCPASATTPTTCANWTYASKTGMSSCTACPALTSGWTKANSTGTGWKAHTSCVQISPTVKNCDVGDLKQVAASDGATTWGASSVNTALSAQPGAFVDKTACTLCTGANYSAGGTVQSCTPCPSIYTSDTTNGKSVATQCRVTTGNGYYVKAAGDATLTQCENTGFYCPSASVAYGSANEHQACPTPADHKMAVADIPSEYYTSAIAATGINTPAGRWSISQCQVINTYEGTRGRLYDYRTYNTTSERYDIKSRSVLWHVAKPGYYLTGTKTGCGTYAYYAEAKECEKNSFCPGKGPTVCNASNKAEVQVDNFGMESCSTLDSGKYATSDGGAAANSSAACYLMTTSSNFVKTAGEPEVACEANGYCPGNIRVYYGSTGGRNTCPTKYPLAAASSNSDLDCYVTTAAGKYVATVGAGQVNCAGTGYYCPGGTNVYSGAYGSRLTTGGRNQCPAGYRDLVATSSVTKEAQCTMNVAGGKYVATAKESAASGTCAAGYARAAHTVTYGNTSSCTACTGATYADATGMAACTACPTAKTYASAVTGYAYWNTGKDGDHTISTGCYANFSASTLDNGSMTSSHCYLGTDGDYGNTVGKAGCWVNVSDLKCNAGYYNYAANTGSTQPGYKSRTELLANACVDVGDGYWSAADVLTRNQCPVDNGYNHSAAPRSSQDNCYLTTTAGNYVKTAGAGQTQCEAGYYCPGNTNVYYSGTTPTTGGRNAATPGHFVANAGASAQVACAVGSYTSAAAQTACIACGSGTGIDEHWGMTTTGVGQTSCNAECPDTENGIKGWRNPVWNKNNTVTDLCVPNSCVGDHYLDTDTNTCPRCDSFANGLYPHSPSNGTTGGREACFARRSELNGYHIAYNYDEVATACQPGSYSYYVYDENNGGSVVHYGESYNCTKCGGNTYSDKEAATECTPCLDNYVITSGNSHDTALMCELACPGGSYVPYANSTTCANVGVGYWVSANTTPQGEVGKRYACPAGMTTIGYGLGADEAGDCGRILHVGDNKLYLRSDKKTTPSLNVLVDGTKFYGNMSTESKTLTSGVDESLRIKNGDTTYSVYDDMVDYKSSSGSATKLNPTINSTSIVPANISASAGVTNWSAVFSYGTLSGISACTADAGSRFNVDETKNFAAGGSGSQCWCKMTSPATSGWVYITSLGSTCNNKCAYICAQNIGSNRNAPTTRTNMFSSAGVL